MNFYKHKISNFFSNPFTLNISVSYIWTTILYSQKYVSIYIKYLSCYSNDQYCMIIKYYSNNTLLNEYYNSSSKGVQKY